MAKNFSIDSMEQETCLIRVGEEIMTTAEYKKRLKEAKKKAEKEAKKQKKTDTAAPSEPKEIGVVASTIEELVKPMTALKSLQVYKNHAYRSWGTIANEILSYRGIKRPMSSYCVKYAEFNGLIEDIKNMAKRNEKAAYQYVEKLAWKLDDMKSDINAIMKAVNESGVCVTFKNHEAINGVGRQLGLKTVLKKCLANIGAMEEAINTLKNIADKGTDPFCYASHMSLKERTRLGI